MELPFLGAISGGVIFLLLITYFLPFSVALFRGHHRKVTVFFVNLLLGWTVIGWWGILFWAIVSDARDPLEIASKAAAVTKTDKSSKTKEGPAKGD